jgi:hypothetical protein
LIKPRFLFHGSPNKNITLFKPKVESFRDKNEGPIVFATPDKALSSMFIVPSNDLWTHSGLFGKVHYFVCSDKDRFKKLDKGGSIYTVDSKYFVYDLNKGLGDKEWTSKTAVKPITKENISSALETMIDLGVQVYFVDQETFNKINNSTDFGNEILRNTLSENIKHNKNIICLPKVDNKKI